MLRDGVKLTTVFLVGWSILSALLLLFIGWGYLRNSVYQSGVDSGYQAGAEAAFENRVQQGAASAAGQIYNDIINKSANTDCNTVFIEFEGRRVDLVNVQCLQIQAPAETVEDPDANRG